MNSAEKLATARAELLAYETRYPRSKEDVAEEAKVWLENARTTTGPDVPGLLGSAGRYGQETAYALVLAYVLDSQPFADWLLARAVDQRLPSRKEREKQLDRFRRAVRASEAACVREEIENKKAALEDELKALA